MKAEEEVQAKAARAAVVTELKRKKEDEKKALETKISSKRGLAGVTAAPLKESETGAG